ncbi:hypothetical protein GIB67_011974 [Kingdonia uniflora]|uniref:Uncharacterized protein n=1 Tax=Kingdonia uniflora TaxID=39325 RepID=A0A7J7M013_9MAGN|nr:hypothetical protein GIB67_011974 [Kingdonia uniflora]
MCINWSYDWKSSYCWCRVQSDNQRDIRALQQRDLVTTRLNPEEAFSEHPLSNPSSVDIRCLRIYYPIS